MNVFPKGEQALRVSQVAAILLALGLVLVGIVLGWALVGQPRTMDVRSETSEMDEATSSRLSDSKPGKSEDEPEPPLPKKDVPGADVPSLPRYPGSVRVEYERGERDGLVLTRARYLTRENRDVVRGFYRGIFRAREWTVANVEFSEDRWEFFVVQGEREARVGIESRSPGTAVDVRSSSPVPAEESKEEQPAPKMEEPTPEPAEPAPVPIQPAPAPVEPAPVEPAPQPVAPPPQAVEPAPPVPDDDADDYEGDDD